MHIADGRAAAQKVVDQIAEAALATEVAPDPTPVVRRTSSIWGRLYRAA
jgi:hypothetical protein